MSLFPSGAEVEREAAVPRPKMDDHRMTFVDFNGCILCPCSACHIAVLKTYVYGQCLPHGKLDRKCHVRVQGNVDFPECWEKQSAVNVVVIFILSGYASTRPVLVALCLELSSTQVVGVISSMLQARDRKMVSINASLRTVFRYNGVQTSSGLFKL